MGFRVSIKIRSHKIRRRSKHQSGSGVRQRVFCRSYKELFDKIDITKEGFVDWDKLVEYMLLEFYEVDEKVKTTQVSHLKTHGCTVYII